jgi:hypothetical protein
MTRLIALLILLASCNGCMLYDEMYYDAPPIYTPAQAPNSCGMPAGNINVAQSIEPPR